MNPRPRRPRRPRVRLALIALILGALAAVPAFGWGEDGHRITGRIAFLHLTPRTRDAVRELLGAQSTLEQATVWADEIKSDPSWDWARPMHYVNVPRGATSYDRKRDCADGACVVTAVEECTRLLQAPDTPREKRAEALKFLVHFVGDVHQPMHVSHADDRGGNEAEVEFDGEETNLHRLWDSDLLRRGSPGSWMEHAEQINGRITPDLKRRWQRERRPEAWANESLAYVQRIYDTGPTISDAYYRAALPVVEERLAIAGIRMADLLNRIFDPEHTEADDTPGGKTGEAPAGGRATDPDAPPAPPTPPGPESFVSVVADGPCGDGQRMFLVNRHPDRTIRATVRKSWTVDGAVTTRDEVLTVRPGERARKALGCSTRAAARGEVRRFTWTIVDATFR